MEPDAVIAATIEDAVRAVAHVDRHRRFDTAKKHLVITSFDFIIANLRLGAFNGLHLVSLASSTSSARAIVYTQRREPALAKEVQRAGAFYDTAERLSVTSMAYLTGALPSHDRRDAAMPDRRTTFRGGRRSWDEHLFSQQPQP